MTSFLNRVYLQTFLFSGIVAATAPQLFNVLVFMKILYAYLFWSIPRYELTSYPG